MTNAAPDLLDVAAAAARDHGRGALRSAKTANLDVKFVVLPPGAGAGVALVIPKGAHRAIRCAAGRLVYLTCHARRTKLTPLRRSPQTAH